MTITHSNRLRLEDIRTTPIGEIATLPADHLALLQEDAEAALTAAKTTAEWIAGAIALRYADRAQAARRTENKDTGTVRFEDGSVTVVADLPKRVDWDQRALAAVVERIRAAGDDPSEYIDSRLQGSRAQIHRLAREHPRRLRACPHGQDRQGDVHADTQT